MAQLGIVEQPRERTLEFHDSTDLSSKDPERDVWSVWFQVKQDLLNDVEKQLKKHEFLVAHLLQNVHGTCFYADGDTSLKSPKKDANKVQNVYSPEDYPTVDAIEEEVLDLNGDSTLVIKMSTGTTVDEVCRQRESTPGQVFPQAWQDHSAWDQASPPAPKRNGHLGASFDEKAVVKEVRFRPETPAQSPPVIFAALSQDEEPRKEKEQGQHFKVLRPSGTSTSLNARRSSVVRLKSCLSYNTDDSCSRGSIRELTRMDYMLSTMERWMEEAKLRTKEPKRSGILSDLERGSVFNTICPFVILLDAIYTAWSSNRSAKEPNIKPTGVMQTIELLFTCFYAVELILKLVVHQKYFFINENWNWNWFDLVLVIQALVDLFCTFILDVEGGSATFMRIVRLMKIGKILRVFRAVRFLRDLRAMIVAIVNCMSALFWAFITLALILYVFALMLVQSMSGYIADTPDLSERKKQDIQSFFGSLELTALTLYMSTTGGMNWIEPYRRVEDVGALQICAFIFFIGFFGFAVITILSGIFIEKALIAAQPDRESTALEMRRMDEQETHQLRDLLSGMDQDRNGCLTFTEFSLALEDMHVQAYLRSLGLAVNDAAMFFDLLAHQSGSQDLPIAELSQRMCRMKGTATSMDLQSLMYEVSVIRKLVLELVRVSVPKHEPPSRAWSNILREVESNPRHSMSEVRAIKAKGVSFG